MDPTLYHLRLNFVASCLDENDNLVAYEVDTEGVPTIYSFTGSIELAGEDTRTTKNEKIAAAALVGFGSIDVPVVFI